MTMLIIYIYRVNIFRCVHGSNTFPFVLSLGITVQGIIFAVSQSRGLDGLFKAGCSIISQFMWPGMVVITDLEFCDEKTNGPQQSLSSRIHSWYSGLKSPFEASGPGLSLRGGSGTP